MMPAGARARGSMTSSGRLRVHYASAHAGVTPQSPSISDPPLGPSVHECLRLGESHRLGCEWFLFLLRLRRTITFQISTGPDHFQITRLNYVRLGPSPMRPVGSFPFVGSLLPVGIPALLLSLPDSLSPSFSAGACAQSAMHSAALIAGPIVSLVPSNRSPTSPARSTSCPALGWVPTGRASWPESVS